VIDDGSSDATAVRRVAKPPASSHSARRTRMSCPFATGRWSEALLLWSGGAAASALLRSGSGHNAAWGLLYPCDALALGAVLALGILDRRRRRPVRWKGREVSAD
jgi:peptidoglycan/LPS O-acetylase OafA/YrhL